MGERVLRWSFDAAICTGFLSLAALLTLWSGAWPLTEEGERGLPQQMAARWAARLSGMVTPPRDGSGTDEALRQELRALEAKLDEIETRLLSGLSTVQLWRELAERHQTVSQIACENAGEHLREMVASQKRDRQRRAKARKEKAKEEREAKAEQ